MRVIGVKKIAVFGVLVLSLILGTLLPGCGLFPPPSNNNDINGVSVTWSGTVNVNSIVNVCNGGVLTILPGATVRFAQGAGLLIGNNGEGTLIADGDAGNKITFTGTSQTPGWWCGIEFGEQARCDAGHTMMDNCIVEYTGYDSIYGRQPAGIGAWGGTVKPPLTNLEVRNYTNYGFVFTDGAEFGAVSMGLKVHDGFCPFSVDANTVRTIPEDTQNLYSNTLNVVEVGANDNTVSITGTWPKIFAPVYFINNDLTISGCALTIASGCTIKVAYGCCINVGDIGGSGIPAATLNCPGDSTSQGAYFTSYSGANGGWGGIWFYDNTFGNLQYVTVEKGGGITSDGYAANIYIYRNTMQDTPTIQHSLIRYAYNSGINNNTYGIVGYYHSKSYTGGTDGNSFYNNGPGTNAQYLIGY